ncbi:MAG: pilin [Alcanivoracaceae bacterium]
MAAIGLKRSRALLAGFALTAMVGAGYALWILIQPALHDYRVERQIRHALARSDMLQGPLREFIERTGFWPASALDARLDPSLLAADDIIDELRLGASSLLTVTFRADLAGIGGNTLVFIPEKTADGAIRWRCDEGTLDPALRPNQCRGRDPVAARPSSPSPRLELPAPVREAMTRQQDPLAARASRVRQELEAIVGGTRSIRQKASQYLMETGSLPASNTQIGLAEPHRLAHGTVFRRIGLQPNGSILYEFSDHITGMEGHRFSLAPTGLPGVWRCESALPADHLPALCSKQVL